MNDKQARIAQLHATIHRAKQELAEFEPKMPVLMKLQKELEEMEDDWAKNGFNDDNIGKLADIVVLGLNMLNSMADANVMADSGVVTIATDENTRIEFDPDREEWYVV